MDIKTPFEHVALLALMMTRVLARRLQELGQLDEATLEAAFAEAGPWRLRRSGWWLPLRRAAADKPAAASVIEPVALPAMARFHARLGSAIGRTLPVPPPHVTVFVEGDAEGIGAPDAASLARLRDGPAVRAR